MQVSETSLVQRAQLGDATAFEELIRRTSRLVFARLHLETGDVHRSEDLLQETLLTAFKSLNQLTEPEKFRPWLLRIASNTAVNAVKHDLRQKRTPRPLPGALPSSNGTPPPEARLEQDE